MNEITKKPALTINDIEGWYSDEIKYVIEVFEAMIKKYNPGIYDGGIAEIGTYLGKSFCIFNRYARDKSFAFDLYEDISRNFSVSGHSFDQIDFLLNLKHFDVQKGENVITTSCDSLVEGELIVDTCKGTPIKYFSIDGGHDSINVTTDLQTAERIVGKGGLIFVDDYHNHTFPGVTEGLHEYLRVPSKYVPLVCFNNQVLILCQHADYKRYFKYLDTELRNIESNWMLTSKVSNNYTHFIMIKDTNFNVIRREEDK